MKTLTKDFPESSLLWKQYPACSRNDQKKKKREFSGFSPSQQPGLHWFPKSSWTWAAHSHYHHCFYVHFSLQRLAWDIHILCPVNIHELGGNFILTHIKTVRIKSAMSIPNERQLPCVVSNPTITWCETFISSVSAQSCICLLELVLSFGKNSWSN